MPGLYKQLLLPVDNLLLIVFNFMLGGKIQAILGDEAKDQPV